MDSFRCSGRDFDNKKAFMRHPAATKRRYVLRGDLCYSLVMLLWQTGVKCGLRLFGAMEYVCNVLQYFAKRPCMSTVCERSRQFKTGL